MRLGRRHDKLFKPDLDDFNPTVGLWKRSGAATRAKLIARAWLRCRRNGPGRHFAMRGDSESTTAARGPLCAIFSAGATLYFDCVKYRNKVKAVACHNHLPLPGEAGRFLFERRVAVFQTPLFEQVRRAWHSTDAVYGLPFTVAEGLAAKHRIPREQFLAEDSASHDASRKAAAAKERRSGSCPRPFATYQAGFVRPVASGTDRKQYRTRRFQQATERLLHRTPLSLGKVAAVLDNSYSSSGTQEKKRRPLGVAWAVDRVLAAASREYHAFWMHPFEGTKPEARGATDLSTPILDALETSPEMLVIVSDAVENDPPGAPVPC